MVGVVELPDKGRDVHAEGIVQGFHVLFTQLGEVAQVVRAKNFAIAIDIREIAYKAIKRPQLHWQPLHPISRKVRNQLLTPRTPSMSKASFTFPGRAQHTGNIPGRTPYNAQTKTPEL